MERTFHYAGRLDPPWDGVPHPGNPYEVVEPFDNIGKKVGMVDNTLPDYNEDQNLTPNLGTIDPGNGRIIKVPEDYNPVKNRFKFPVPEPTNPSLSEPSPIPIPGVVRTADNS